MRILGVSPRAGRLGHVFVSGYFSFILKGEANVVEPVEQTISLEIANVETG